MPIISQALTVVLSMILLINDLFILFELVLDHLLQGVLLLLVEALHDLLLRLPHVQLVRVAREVHAAALPRRKGLQKVLQALHARQVRGRVTQGLFSKTLHLLFHLDYGCLFLEDPVFSFKLTLLK